MSFVFMKSHPNSIEKIVRFILQYKAFFWLLWIVLVVGSLFLAKNLTIDSNYMAFLPDHFPSVQNLKKVMQKTGSFGNYMIVTENAPLEARRKFLKEFSQKVEKLDWVDYAEYKKSWESVQKNKLLYLSKEDLSSIYKRIQYNIDLQKNPMVVSLFDEADPTVSLDLSDIERKYQQTSFGSSYFEDPKQLYTIGIVWPKGSMADLAFAEKTYQQLQKIIDELNPQKFHADLKVTIGGEYRSKIDEYHALRNDLVNSAGIAITGIVLLLIVFYRRAISLLFVLTPLLVGMVISFGLTYILVGRLNLLTAFLIAILFGLGVDYGIYLFSRYVQDRRKGMDQVKAVSMALGETGRALFGAALTTAAAFLTLLLMRFQGFYELGLVVASGVLLVFFSFFFFSPLLWDLLDRLFHADITKRKTTFLWLKKIPIYRSTIWIWIVVALISAISIKFISFEFDYGKLRSKNNTYWSVKSKIHKVFPLSKTPAIILTETLEDAKAVVDELKSKLPQLKTVDTVKSILDFYPEEIKIKKAIIHKIRTLINSNETYFSDEDKKTIDRYRPYLDVGTITVHDLPTTLKRTFLGREGTKGYLILIYDKVSLSNADNARAYLHEIGKITANGKDFYAAEGSLIGVQAMDLMIEKSELAVFIMLLGVFLLLIIIMRSFKKALKVFLPLVVALLITLGIMYLLGLKFNIFNLVVFPILIGLGVDASLHLFQRFEEDGSNKKALENMVQYGGNPLVVATLTTMIGFGSMMSSSHGGLSSIGELACIGMLVLLLVNLTFLPALLKNSMKPEV